MILILFNVLLTIYFVLQYQLHVFGMYTDNSNAMNYQAFNFFC